ncbi:MAG: hypothetical protein ACJ0QL_06115 [Parvicellaceae bacterium]
MLFILKILITLILLNNSFKIRLIGNFNYFNSINKSPNSQLEFSEENMSFISNNNDDF